ncbi:MAG TPA: GGDEF domain-containing protein [Noviherbaspirillum sp.]|nr:GGDEF domain-containing protein [Noviherbaspirillum sp.]
MSAVIQSLAALPSAQRGPAPSAPSFGAWLQGLSSGLHLAGSLHQVLDDFLREAPGTGQPALQSRLDLLLAHAEARAAQRRIRELEAELARMRELVCEDQLTGSLNRRGLAAVLERELARAERRRAPLCVALLDLDDFKKLNDTHGHCAGDAALVHLVRVAREALRKTDVIGRFGGEEFMIVLPDTPLDDAMHAMARVQGALREQAFRYQDACVPVTFSAGVALCRAGDDQAAPVARADRALYEAKSAGKNRVVSAA